MDESINMELQENKLSVMRRYPLETLITALFMAVSVLCGYVIKNANDIENLHTKMHEYMKEDAKVMITTIENNTRAFEQLQKDIEKSK